MKKTKTLYWIFTGLIAALMLFSAIPDIMSSADAIKMVKTQLLYPDYFIPFIGVAKLLGAIAILIPGYPRIKEWAYAGLAYDLIAATYSIAAVGNSFKDWWPMTLFIALLFTSYFFYHKKMDEELANV